MRYAVLLLVCAFPAVAGAQEPEVGVPAASSATTAAQTPEGAGTEGAGTEGAGTEGAGTEGAGPEDTTTEDAALRMLRLRLEACEARGATGSSGKCPEPAATPATSTALKARGALYGSYLRYTDPWNQSSVSALTAVAGVDGTAGGVWLGTVVSKTGLNYASSDYSQNTTVVGGWTQLGSLRLDGSLGRLTSSSTTSDGTWVGTAHGLWLPGALGLDLGLAVAKYRSFNVTQLDPKAVWLVSPELELALGGRVSSTSRASVQAGATWRPGSRLELGASAWAGERQYAIEASGLSIWSNDDVYKGGYRLSATWLLSPKWALDAVWQHDLGSEQSSTSHDYQLLGGTLGLRFQF